MPRSADRPDVIVHAVEDTTVQLCWRGLPAAHGRLGVGGEAAEVEGGPPAWAHRTRRPPRRLSPLPYGPGAVTIGGLRPATTYPVWWQARGGLRQSLGPVTTLSPPPGDLLARFATVSDLHIGERRFGLLQKFVDVTPRSAALDPYPVRCARAALGEAEAWGATTVVGKGDLSEACRPAQLEQVRALVSATAMDPLLQLGNHDRIAPVDPGAILAPLPVAERGVPVVRDLPGVRLVLGDSPSPDDRWGHIDGEQRSRLVEAVAEAPGPAVVSFHHAPEAWPVPAFYPPGIVHRDAKPLLRALRRANPTTLLLAGHSHRNRTYRVQGLLVAEVGSTKDYPGGWAGYAVHEGGIRQVVRRTEAPDVLAWTEATAGALAGLWGRWSPGTLADRCWSHAWPGR